MITLKNLNQPKSIPAVFDTEKEFIDYTIDEALWSSLPTGEIPTMEKWGFTKIVDDIYTSPDGKTKEIVKWKASLEICIDFWSIVPIDKWQITFQ